MVDECVSCVGFGADSISVVRTDINDRYIRSLQCFLQTLISLLGIFCVEHADEDHNLSALWQRFLYKFTSLSAGSDIISSDVAGTIAVWCVAILCNDQCLRCCPVQHW